MEAAQLPWRPIGELFVERGMISADELEQALAEQAATGLKLGEILVQRNLISSPELTQVLMEQLGREVAKEEGFGSGLWSEIRRRNMRQVDEEPPSEDLEAASPFGGGLTRKLGGPSTVHERGESDPDPSKATDFAGPGLMPPDEPDDAYEIRVELDVVTGALHEAQREIEALTERARERDRTIAELQAGNDAAQSEADQTDESVEALELALALEQVDRLDAALVELAGRTTDLERKLVEEQHAHNETRQQRNASLDKANRDYDALEDAQRALDTARSEVNEARAESEDLRRGLASAKSALDEERGAHETTRARSEQAEALGREQEARISDLMAELETARSAVEQAPDETAALQRTIVQLHAEAEAARQREAEARLALADTVSATSQLESQLSSASQCAAELAEEVTALQAALDEARTTRADEVDPTTAADEDHVCLIAGTEGYRLVDRPGPPPAIGAAYELDEALYVVTRVGASPLPFDGRRCAYLLAD